MLKKIPFSALFLIFSSTLFAQIVLPQEAEIGTGKVTAHVSTTGALIDGFFVPNANGGPPVSLLNEVSIWMCGVDPGGNLYMGIQQKDSVNDDFFGGFRGLPQSQGIWKVTRQQIAAHLADLNDNGHIDNPIPAIYGWPAFRNPFSLDYNGFAIDTFDRGITAPFQDVNYDDIYNPDDGDYPFGVEVGVFHMPTDMLFLPFHVDRPPPCGNPVFCFPTTLNCSALLFSYDCDDANFLEDAVFTRIALVSKATYTLDSFFLAYYVDGDIGGRKDDYMGTNDNRLYFYNADNYDEGGFGGSSPMLAFHGYLSLRDEDGNNVSAYSIMNINPGDGVPPPPQGTDDPNDAVEYYRYMTGSWRDGVPLTFGGYGKLGTQPTSFIFPGNPAHPNEWSEVSAQRPSGDRRAVISFGPATLVPNVTNYALFSLIHIPPNPIGEQLANMDSYTGAHFGFLYVDYFPPDPTPFDSIICLHPTTSTTSALERPIRIFPNPAHDQLTVQTETADVATIAIYSVLGVKEFSGNYTDHQTSTIQIGVKGLTPGIHLLQCIWKDGYKKTWKVLIE